MDHLTLAHRQQLKRLLENNFSKQKIADLLEVHLSTIYREIKRNSINGEYHPDNAHKLYRARKKVIGGLTKTKRVLPLTTRKTKYELFADRRFIYWLSDCPHKRAKYFIVAHYTGPKCQFYKHQLGLEKTFHYRKDIPLLQLLLSSLPNIEEIKKQQSNPTQTKEIDFTTTLFYYYTKVAVLEHKKAA